LIDGNDPRLIDVGLLSKRPFGGVTSWQFAGDPAEPTLPVFSRDLLQVEILSLLRQVEACFRPRPWAGTSFYQPWYQLSEPDRAQATSERLKKPN
jgi:hypothetical protein